MQVGTISDQRFVSLRRDAAAERQLIQQAPAGDKFEFHGDIQLARLPKDYVVAEATPGGVSVVKKGADGVETLRSETVGGISSTGWQVAAAAVGGIAGALLFSGKERGGSLGGALAGLLFAGAGALVAREATRTPVEERNERVTQGKEGITVDRVHLRDGEIVMAASRFHRTAPFEPVDPAKVKEFIASIELPDPSAATQR